MNKDFAQSEALPYKKAGKSQTQSSPNKKGCEMNDFQEHDYQIVQLFRAMTKVSPSILNRVRFTSKIYGVKRYMCVFCGKNKKRGNQGIQNQEAFTNILQVSHNDEVSWYEVNPRSDEVTLDLIAPLNW